MNLAEKILADTSLPGQGVHVKPGDAVLVKRGRRLLARVHHRPGALTSWPRSTGRTTELADPAQVRGVRGPPHLRRRGGQHGARSRPRSRACAACSASSRRRPACATIQRDGGVSPGICHQVAREKIIEPGDFIQATDSHTCMGGAPTRWPGAWAPREYAALLTRGFTPIEVPESIRFELTGKLRAGVTAKDVMLYMLARSPGARRRSTG